MALGVAASLQHLAELGQLFHQQLAVLVGHADQRHHQGRAVVLCRRFTGGGLVRGRVGGRSRRRRGGGRISRRRRCRRLGAAVQRLADLLQRQGLQGLTDALVGLLVRRLFVTVGVELVVEHVLGFQKGVDDVGAKAQLAAPGMVEQVLEQVGGALQDLEAERTGAALDRVGGAEDGVELFGVRRCWVQLQQMAFHVRQQFFGFLEEGVVEVGDIHACVTLVLVQCGSSGGDAGELARAV